MSQTVETKGSDIVDQINSLGRLASKVAELQDKKENSEDKRKDRIQKNSAFNEVKSEIEDVQKTFNILQRAVALANQFDARVPRSDIEDVLDEYRPRVQDFETKEYGDFKDVSEISSTRKEFEAFQEVLDEFLTTVKDNLRSAAEAELKEVNTRESVLRVPDVGTESDSEAVQNYKQKLVSISRGQIFDPEEIETTRQAYDSVDIDIATITEDYGLSDESGRVLLRFLNNETVTLAEVDDGVLDELKKLEEFSKRLKIQF